MSDLLLSIVLLAAGQTPYPMPADTLDGLRWKHRVLIVLYEDASDPRVGAQYDEWKREEVGALERDMVLISVPYDAPGRLGTTALSAESSAQIYETFSEAGEAFAVVLVGKDGTEKRRWSEPVAMGEVFAIIDAMPMRRREMRQRDG